MNWKIVSAGITSSISLAGATSYWFLFNPQQPPTTPKIKSFKGKFPSVKINSEFVGGKYNSGFWKPKIEKIKRYYSDPSKPQIRKRLIASMSKVVDSSSVARYFDWEESAIQVGDFEGRLLAQYCNKAWNSESEKFKGDEDIIEDFCLEEGAKFNL
ncbi:hypothetical protein A6V39_05700 [Candidatus Mycoplasma haematobovis]|uniref:Uncharacterized protein n=1 Tax=Candidatus Mycoplasma haematobovis TaxID=432608 RepID=A0A1A9QFL3_9MOLU|nr:hypothetical protein [Candidatus Mycoplasma haematobovis]OAL10801.1 hypothetical protein A6V39_05700 [Candidatus Mycoplasma haematobovis]